MDGSTTPNSVQSTEYHAPHEQQSRIYQTHEGHRPHKAKKKKVGLGLLYGLIAIIILLGGMALGWHYHTQLASSEPEQVIPSEYQAVFLTNNQVYFGKIVTVNSTYIKLVDIYYLQLQEALQPASSGGTSSKVSTTDSTSSDSSSVQLIKLGSELQGPEDQMNINREQVLFWENLKPSGKVTQAIDKYQNTQ
jgi:hypothetical protein